MMSFQPGCAAGLDFLRHVEQRLFGRREKEGRPGSLTSPDAEASLLFRLSLGGLRPRSARVCFAEKRDL